MIFLKTKYKENLAGGFSLIELLVVVSIFLIVTTITLFKQSKFSSDILITNTAYEVALSIREAQVLGVGSKQQSGEQRKQAYGVYFSGYEIDKENGQFTQYSESPLSDVYSFFYDAGDDRFIIVGGNNISLTRSQRFRNICAIDTQGEKKCSSDSGPLKALNIAFVKPNLDAKIIGQDSNGEKEEFSSAEIVVESSLGDKCRTITINSVGQIAIKAVEPGTTGCEQNE